MKKILHVVTIKSPRETVYKAITMQKGLASWWSTKVTVENGVGGVADFTFGGDFNPDMKVTKLEDNKAVHWMCVSGHDNWQDNTFSFELSDTEEGTMLMFTQIYAQELDDVTYGVYNYNWGYYLDSLREYLEDGKGKPYPAA